MPKRYLSQLITTTTIIIIIIIIFIIFIMKYQDYNNVLFFKLTIHEF